MMDMGVWVDVDENVARKRVIKRNWEAGIVEDVKKCEERGKKDHWRDSVF